ncbi:MAG: hypothetical protein ACUVXI_08205 [bacterium]
MGTSKSIKYCPVCGSKRYVRVVSFSDGVGVCNRCGVQFTVNSITVEDEGGEEDKEE